jgi:hypothetical protein
MAKRTVPEWLRDACIERDGGECVKCGEFRGLQCHHIVPVADGGEDVIENTASLCYHCHREWHLLWEGSPYAAALGFGFPEWVAWRCQGWEILLRVWAAQPALDVPNLWGLVLNAIREQPAHVADALASLKGGQHLAGLIRDALSSGDIENGLSLGFGEEWES